MRATISGMIILVAGALLWGALPGGQEVPQEAPASRPAGDPPAPLRLPAGEGPLLFISGNELGHIRPCGCTKPAIGGIHRRAKVLDQVRAREPGVFAVSGGDLVVAAGPQQQLKLETDLIAMSVMGYDALVPGRGELNLGLDYLLQAREIAGFPITLLNVERDGAPVFERMVRLGESQQVICGLVPAGIDVPGAVVTPPGPALSALLGALGDDDRLVLFWGGSEVELRPVLKQVPPSWRPRVVAIIGGSADEHHLRPAEGGIPIVAQGSKGRFIGLLRPEAAQPLESYRLAQGIVPHEEIAAILDGYRDAVRAADFIGQWPRLPAPADYLGAAACAECHEESCRALAETAHNAAFARLVETNDHFDPECVPCHVVGFGIEGGYVDPESTPQHLNVTCEACHGPGGHHVREEAPTPAGKLGDKSCVVCHDADNSPKFDFKTYWPRMAHPPK